MAANTMPAGRQAKIKTEKVLEKKIKVAPNKEMAAKIDNFFEKKEEFVGNVETANPVAEAAAGVIAVENEKSKFKIMDKKIILRILFGALIVGLTAFSGYFYYQYKKATSANAAKDEIAEYAGKMSKFMVLPVDEQPTMATVADKEKLVSQTFFAKAENGDKVFFYSKSQKAILYRPSSNMIIEATSMAGGIPNASAQPAPAAAVAPQEKPVAAGEQVQSPIEEPKQAEVAAEVKHEASVFVENGTTIKGLAKIISEKIAQIPGVTVAGTGNTVGDFQKTIVVDLGGNNAEIAAEISKTLGCEVGSLPTGETKPEADILVIGGSL